MYKKALVSLMLFPSLAFADVAEYKGKVTDILLGKSQVIKVGVAVDEANPLLCQKNENEPWLLSFERGQDYSTEWFDLLNLVRRTQETVRIGYVENSNSICSIEYLALLKGDGNADDDDQISDSLVRTGQYGNVAQIYTNGLTESNYHASSYYSGDVPAAAFDGYVFNDQIVDGEGAQISRGIWLVKKDLDNKETEYWLQVEFEQAIDISGFRVMVNAKSAELGRGPRHVTVLTSMDGEDFEDVGQYSLSQSIDQRANLPTKIEAKVFRLKVNSNHGDKYIEIDELEVYSD
ncbi:discoidin domain-containing protein [Thalassotalea marina]|uniref:F5/8 type C domain-containing protein n=1 Tax=Thalassotalea marina TaxID=1673741 RepID=A0A919BID3_9GAMM|nr:discoidin domain-containing protein [Thalassotalea marina]GHF91223.1 hypothetical protein GCM10017161_18760 [Thalassotalea marina]